MDTKANHRVQLDFSSDAFEKLGEIKNRAGATSNAETIRNALRLYDWFLQKQSEGYTIQVAKGDSVREIELIFK